MEKKERPKLKVGQRLYWVPENRRYDEPRYREVTAVGRKYATNIVVEEAE